MLLSDIDRICRATLSKLDAARGDLSRAEAVGLVAVGAAVLDFASAQGRPLAALAADRTPTRFSSLAGEALRRALREHAGPTMIRGYDQARKLLFKDVDNIDGRVRDIYTGRSLQTTTIPSASGPEGMNVEHAFPRRRGVKGTPAERDMHHLFVADAKANAERSSWPFGVVVTASWQKAGAKLGLDERGQTVFEPPADQRGNIARALFYVSAVYGLPIPPEEEAVLRRWHALDAVDDAERARAARIEHYQGNANPFVDDGALVSAIEDF